MVPRDSTAKSTNCFVCTICYNLRVASGVRLTEIRLSISSSIVRGDVSTGLSKSITKEQASGVRWKICPVVKGRMVTYFLRTIV